ncbi:MAG TPA: DUF4181 domain-containing protein [Firmicutes bacterium]|nr:DUF4181 domain-containing protein [Bacillota bacterium]
MALPTINYPIDFHYVFLYFFVLATVRAFMGWKFDKRSKRYILSVLAMFFSLIIFLGIKFVLLYLVVRYNVIRN